MLGVGLEKIHHTMHIIACSQGYMIKYKPPLLEMRKKREMLFLLSFQLSFKFIIFLLQNFLSDSELMGTLSTFMDLSPDAIH